MDNLEFKKLLVQHLRIPRRFIQTLDIKPAILLTELINKEIKMIGEGGLRENDFFYHEMKYIIQNTALTRRKIDPSRLVLEEKGLITTKYGEGKRLYYKLNTTNIIELFFPGNECIDTMNLIYDLLLDDGYITYSIPMAHELGENETIMLQTLIGKRKYYQKSGKLINGYFYASNSDVEKDTCLKRRQQNAIIKKLQDLDLINVEYGKDSTRYFCLNDSKIMQLNSLGIPNVVKVKNIGGFDNPFNNSESTNVTGVESTNVTGVESTFQTSRKNKIACQKEQIDHTESSNGTSNNRKNQTKNNIKNIIKEELLMKLNNLRISKDIIAEISLEYGEAEIEKVINYMIRNRNSIKNTSGFLLDALRKKYEAIEKEVTDNGIELQKKFEEKEFQDEQKKLQIKKEVEKWIEINNDEYKKMYEQEYEKKLNSVLANNEHRYSLYINALVFKHIRDHILCLDS